MQAMVLRQVGQPLEWTELPVRTPRAGEIRLKVGACGVCRTDLHVVDGELAAPRLPLIPGHEIVGRVLQTGSGVLGFAPGDRIGVPWLGHTCGACDYCRDGRENLCDEPLYTGYTRDGGYATEAIVEAAYAFRLPEGPSEESLAPLMCAGLIGWRSLRLAGDPRRLGLYGFGAAAHLVAQVALAEGREVYAYTRPNDVAAQAFARRLGATWAGGSDESPVLLDAAILYAPAGELVPVALRSLRKGGRVVCAGIHMSDIPGFAYRWLWEERSIRSVANLTRRDGREFLAAAARLSLRTTTTRYPLARANEALADLRAGRVSGAAVLVP